MLITQTTYHRFIDLLQVYTIAEISETTGISLPTLYKWQREGLADLSKVNFQNGVRFCQLANLNPNDVIISDD